VRPASDVSRVEVVTETGGVFVVVEGGRTAVATTVPEPTAGLVIYDLRTALRRLAEEPAPEKAKPKTKKEKEVSDA